MCLHYLDLLELEIHSTKRNWLHPSRVVVAVNEDMFSVSLIWLNRVKDKSQSFVLVLWMIHISVLFKIWGGISLSITLFQCCFNQCLVCFLFFPLCVCTSVSQALRENTYPFLAMIMLKDRKMTVVGRLEGLIQSEDLLNQLTFIMEANQTYLMSERLER